MSERSSRKGSRKDSHSDESGAQMILWTDILNKTIHDVNAILKDTQKRKELYDSREERQGHSSIPLPWGGDTLYFQDWVTRWNIVDTNGKVRVPGKDLEQSLRDLVRKLC